MIEPSIPNENTHDAQQARCIDVLRREKILHLGVFPAPDTEVKEAVDYPYVFPINYGFDFKNVGTKTKPQYEPKIYMHLGNRPENPRYEAIKNNGHVCFSVESNVQVVPFQFNPCMSTVRYFGVEGRGTCRILDCKASEPEIRYAMNVMMRQMTGNFGDDKYLKWDYKQDLLNRLVVLELSIEKYKFIEHAYGYKATAWTPPNECKNRPGI